MFDGNCAEAMRFYVAGKQPWRTVFFTVGGLTTIALMLDIVWLMIQGA